MVSKIAWSRQEAAILLDSYIEVLKGELPRLCIIKRVSTNLRKMAVNSGFEIDNIFRNECGISFQMQSMESAYRGITVIKPATRLFTEVVALYNENRDEYEKLLEEARAVIDGKANYKDDFSSWLSATLPSASNDALLSSRDTIEPFCLRPKAPLFVKTDFGILKSVQITVPQNKIFHIVNKRQLEQIDTAMPYLLKSLKEGKLNKSMPAPMATERAIPTVIPQKVVKGSLLFPYIRTEQDRRLIAKYPLIYKRLFSVLSEDKQASITIAELFERINHIARCADIKDVLDNASWSKCENRHYSFSEEIVCHDEPTDVPVVMPKSAIELDVTEANNEKYRDVLMQNFKKGFRLGSVIEIHKFKRHYKQMHKKAIEDNDATVERNIILCGIQFGNKVFMPQTMLGDDIRERLFACIQRSFAEGRTALYYQALFDEFDEDFLDYFIYNADMLKAYLSFMLGKDYFFYRSYLSKDANATADPIEEIRTCLKEYASPMTYDMIFENMPHIPQLKIRQILTTNDEFISNARGEYFHVSAVHFSDKELDNIAETIAAAINDKEFLSGNELIDAIKSKYPYTYEKNDALSMVGLRDAIKYHLCRRFSFSGNIISKIGSYLTMSDVFADYSHNRDSFTIDELNVLASELGTGIYFDPVYENSLRVDHDRFVSKTRAHFLVSDTDAVLDHFCTGNYTAIGKVNEFGLFPDAGFPWNEYLLEHYVAAYSMKYSLLHTGFNAGSCVGAIVKKSAGFENFDDCIIAILADSNITLKKQTALQYLRYEGYIARRIYANIEELLIRATAQRNRKGAN